jgi:hypothetical protein
MPEYIQPLREEIRAAMAANDGIMTYRALQQMEKLDSYMKEVMRFYPPGFSMYTHVAFPRANLQFAILTSLTNSILQPQSHERLYPLQRSIHSRWRKH